jgi:hypoxanthine phosphoribosyltransferase
VTDTLWRRQCIYVLDWDRFEDLITGLAESLTHRTIDSVVGIAKGGLIPAIRLAHIIDVPYVGTIAISHNVNSRPFSNRSEAKLSSLNINAESTAKLLLVDDIVGSGETLRLALGAMAAQGFSEVTTASLVVNTSAVTLPDHHAIKVDDWIIFPWERRPQHDRSSASELPLVSV